LAVSTSTNTATATKLHANALGANVKSLASNADLLAVNHQRRVSIQVKTTNAETQHTIALNRDVAGWLGFGYATGYLRDGKPIFNSKNSRLIADVVIVVSFHPQKSRFVVMPIAFAEIFCRRHCD
jgi:hypothetical protein